MIAIDFEMEWTDTIPSSSTSAGKKGQFTCDANFLYVCYATNLWRRFDANAF